MFEKVYGKAFRLSDNREVTIVRIGQSPTFYVFSPYSGEPSISVTGPYSMDDKRFGSIRFEK